MIDLDDLKSLEVCKKCKHVYMPEFKEDSDYARTPYPVNGELCAGCVEGDEQ